MEQPASPQPHSPEAKALHDFHEGQLREFRDYIRFSVEHYRALDPEQKHCQHLVLFDEENNEREVAAWFMGPEALTFTDQGIYVTAEYEIVTFDKEQHDLKAVDPECMTFTDMVRLEHEMDEQAKVIAYLSYGSMI